MGSYTKSVALNHATLFPVSKSWFVGWMADAERGFHRSGLSSGDSFGTRQWHDPPFIVLGSNAPFSHR